jgi:hypothetical protein
MKTGSVLLADDHAPARCDWPSGRRRGKVFLPADFRFCLMASGGRRRETGPSQSEQHWVQEFIVFLTRNCG